MSSVQTAIQVSNVWKRYARLLGQAESLKTAMVERVLRRRPSAEQQQWALEDVSLAVAPGESVALIGPNGSGKTTLLGLISGVLRPSQGTVTARGRVCVLLEAAVAFHPDLTGTENVIIQGMILGMTRQEVRGRLEAIVAFAGAESYIDQPVRTFSLGQRARLGFSVASYLSPDVFLIDEVLAVVDEEFHQTCYERIREMRQAGCAVVFVSHVMDQVRELCERTVLLEAGRITQDGATNEVIQCYEALVAAHRRKS